MRKLLLPGLLLMALFVACENKNPAGPAGVGPGGVTVTQTTSSTSTTSTTSTIPASTTTSTTSTTTTVTGSLARRYVAFQPPPNVPADMTLFFQLLTGGGVVSSMLERLSILGPGPHAVTENEYKVTGVYVMGNGISGRVEGELGGALNPLETGGEFEGMLTANMTGGCTAERQFDGTLTPQTLQWVGGNTLRDCSGSPLAFQTFSLLRSDAPLPSTTTVPSTTTSSSSTSSSTSTTTTTTALVCSYTLAATSVTVPAEGGTGQVVIGTQATCPWIAQSFAPWLTVTPANGSGPATVTYTAAANVNGPARTGTLVIAGLTLTVTQAAPPPPDLLPVLSTSTSYCAYSQTSNQWTATVPVANLGAGPAVASVTRMVYEITKQVVDQNTPPIGTNAQTGVSFVLPANCFSDGVCRFTVTSDATAAVFESNEANNSVAGSCGSSIILR